MPTRWETFPIPVTGGLITDTPPIQLGLNMPGAARSLINFEPSVRGGYRRINGYRKFDSDLVVGGGDDVLGVASFFGIAVACTADGSISTSSGNGWTSQASGRTHANKYRFCKFNFNGTNKLIGVDGSNYPFSWDGTSVTVLNGSTDINGTSHATSFKDHLFYAVDDLVTFSVPFDEADFTVADGAGSFRAPEAVTGLYVFRERLFIFTVNTISVLDGDSEADFRLTSVSENIGCTSEDTIVEVAADVAFLSSDGVRLLGATDRIGDFSNYVASSTIQDQLDSLEANYSQFHAIPIRGKQQYRLFGYNAGDSISSAQGVVGAQLEPENPQSFQWAELLGFKVYTADSQYFNGSELILFASDDGYVYRMDEKVSSDFDGTAIPAYYYTPYLSLTDPTYRKTLYKITLNFQTEGDLSGTVSLNYDLDDSDKLQPDSVDFSVEGSGAVYGQAVYGVDTYATGKSGQIKKQVIGSGYNCSLQFEFLDSVPSFSLDAIFIEFKTDDRQ